jgi:hypothetical protein
MNLPEDHQTQTSVISKLNLLHIHHKQLNSLINIYKHKVAHPIKPLKRKQQISIRSLPKIIKDKSPQKPPVASKSLKNIHPKPFSTHNIESQTLKPLSQKSLTSNKSNNLNPSKEMMPSLYEEKLKLQKLKEAIQVNRENKRKEAKDMKESNRLMRENVILFRENLLQENIQRKKIVDARYKLINSSIENYKVLKKDYITTSFQEAIDQEVKNISKKARQLKDLRNNYESKMMLVEPNKTMPVPIIKEQEDIEEFNSKKAMTNIQKFLERKNDDLNTFMTGIKSAEES